MGRRRPWTKSEDQAVLAGHSEGETLTSIAQRLGRSKQAVSASAKRQGLQWGRAAQTARATAASVQEKALRREQMIGRLYDAGLEVLDRIGGVGPRKQYTTLIRGTGGAQQQVSLSFVPSEDLRNAASAISAVFGAAARLEAVPERASDAVAEQTSLITSLMAGIREAREAQASAESER